MRLDVHPVHQPEPTERVDDAIDERRGNGHHDAAAGAQQVAASGDERGALLIGHVLENGEERDDVVRPAVAQVLGEAAADHARAGGRIRIDPDRIAHATARRTYERPVRASDVEQSPALWDVRQRLADPDALDQPVERCHAGCRAGTAAVAREPSRQSSATMAMKKPIGTTTLKVSSCLRTAIP